MNFIIFLNNLISFFVLISQYPGFLIKLLIAFFIIQCLLSYNISHNLGEINI